VAFGGAAGFTEYYIPGSEDQMFTVFVHNDNNPALNAADGNHVTISVALSTDNTTIFWDHWEDGYDFDPNNPFATADEVRTGGANQVILFESDYVAVHPRNPTHV